jgi:hypothetical protein
LLSIFLVERRVPDGSASELESMQAALIFMCDRLTSRDEPVRCLGSAFVPAQARLLTLFEAESSEAVRAVNQSVHAPFVSLEVATRIDQAAGGNGGVVCR